MPKGYPEPLKRQDVRTILRRIVRRHRAVDDPGRELLPSPDIELAELEAIAATLVATARTASGLPLVVRGEEVLDRLLLIRTARHLLDEAELRALNDGRSARVKWVDLGAPLGIHTKNGVVQRLQRLTVAIQFGERELKNPTTLRENRQRDTRRASSREGWIRSHYRAVEAASRALLEVRDRLTTDSDADDWLDGLEELLDDAETDSSRASVVSHLRFATEKITALAATRQNALKDAALAAHAQASGLIADYRKLP